MCENCDTFVCACEYICVYVCVSIETNVLQSSLYIQVSRSNIFIVTPQYMYIYNRKRKEAISDRVKEFRYFFDSSNKEKNMRKVIKSNYN